MKHSLVLLLAAAAVSFSVNAQDANPYLPANTDASADMQGGEVVIPQLDDADRAEIAKGSAVVLSGARAFFGAINSAVNQAHAERDARNKKAAMAGKSKNATTLAKKDAPVSR